MQAQPADRRLGLGIVGLGMVAKTHALAVLDLKNEVEVRGVYSPSPERRQGFGAAHGFPVADSLEQLLADGGIDVVLVLTPPNARLEIARACVAAGKHVLMEKPLERTVATAEELVGMFERAGLQLGVVLQYRHRPTSVLLRQFVERQPFGALASVHAVVPWWRPQAYYDEPGRGSYARDGGGVLICQAIHTLDLLLHLAGPVGQVQAMARRTRLHKMESEDFVVAGLDFIDGAVGSVTATTADYPGFPESLTFNFERAAARLEAGVLTVWSHDGKVEQHGQAGGTGGGADPMAFTHEWHRAVLADFIAAVRDNRPPAVSGRDALSVQRLIEALLRSSAEGRPVPLPGVAADPVRPIPSTLNPTRISKNDF
jgi:predicted dehydrogenase